MKKRFLGIGVLSGLLITTVIYANQEGFGISTMSFFTGANYETDYLSIDTNFASPTETGFWIKLSNSGDATIDVNLLFGDQKTSTDGENIQTCAFEEDENTSFRQYLSRDTGTLTIPTGGSITTRVSINLNACASGAILGCAVQRQLLNEEGGSFETQLGRANLIDLFVTPDPGSCNRYNIKVFPEKRNLFPMLGKTLPNLKTTAKLALYTTTGLLIYTGIIDIGPGGTGILTTDMQFLGVYHATIQGLSHLRVMLSGVTINGFQRTLDFTTGANILNTTIKDDDNNLVSDDGYQYIFAGEIPMYDGEVNGDDIAKILPHINETNTDFGLVEYDLDADGGITIADIGIILYNLHQWSLGENLHPTINLPRIAY